MAIYLILFAASLLLLMVKNRRLTFYMGNFLLLMMACMCAFRGENVGIDTATYVSISETAYKLEHYSLIDPLYGYLGLFLYDKTGDYRYFQILVGVATYLPLFYIFNKKSQNLAVTVFIFLFATNRYFFETFNIARQCAATSWLLLCWCCLEEKKKVLATVCFIIALGFHHTSIIYFPLALMAYKVKLSNKVVSVSVVATFLFTLFVSDMSMLVSLQQMLFTDEFIGKYNTYEAKLARSIWGLLPVVLPYTAISLLFYKKYSESFIFRIFAYGTIFANFISVLPMAYRISYGIIALEPLIYPMILNVVKFRDLVVSIMICLLIFSLFDFFTTYEKARLVPYEIFSI